MKKTFTYEEVTKIAERRIELMARLASKKEHLRTEYFLQANETISFWSELTYDLKNAKEDYERLLNKSNNILNA